MNSALIELLETEVINSLMKKKMRLFNARASTLKENIPILLKWLRRKVGM